MSKTPYIGFLFCCFATVNCAAYEIEETLSRHYSVVREIKWYAGLDLSLYVEDLQCHIVEGHETRAMVRFDILRKDYPHLVKINQAKLGELEGVSPEVFKNRLVEHRKTLPDKAWFWELLEYEGPFFFGKSSGGGESCDVFAVSGPEEILRVILVYQGTHKVEVAEEVFLYTGLRLPAGAENCRFQLFSHDEPRDQWKSAFVRLDLGDDQGDKDIAGLKPEPYPYSLDMIYRHIASKRYLYDARRVPEWWKVEESEQFDVNTGNDGKRAQIFAPNDKCAWLLPIRGGGRRFLMHVHIGHRSDKSRIEETTGLRFSGPIYNVKRGGFSSGTGDFSHRLRFDTRKDNLVEALDNAARISFKYADLKTDRETLEKGCRSWYADEKLKIKFWQEQLSLTHFMCASGPEVVELPEGQFRGHYVCVTPLDNDNVRVYFTYSGSRR